MKLYRQGDVLVIAIDQTDVPADLKPVPREHGRAILAHGEITGHAHAITEDAAELLTPGEQLVDADGARELYLLVHGDEPVQLVHDEHTTIPLDPGAYKVVRQREYAPEAPVQVQD